MMRFEVETTDLAILEGPHDTARGALPPVAAARDPGLASVTLRLEAILTAVL